MHKENKSRIYIAISLLSNVIEILSLVWCQLICPKSNAFNVIKNVSNCHSIVYVCVYPNHHTWLRLSRTPIV